MMQSLFIAGLYVLGVALTWPWRGRGGLPASFIAAGGFLWGALAWSLAAMAVLATGAAPAAPTIGAVLALGLAAVVLLNRRRESWRFSRTDVMLIAGACAAHVLVVLAARQFNFSSVSFDSVVQVMMGRTLMFEGLHSSLLTEPLGTRGALLPLLHGAAVILGRPYLYSLQPTFALSFVFVFLALGVRMAMRCGLARPAAFGLTVLALAGIMTTYFITFQTVYIHDSMPSMVYVFVAVAALWLAGDEASESWLAPASAAMVAVPLLRIEGSIFASMIMALALGTVGMSYRGRLILVLPAAGVVLAWYGLVAVTHPGGEFLTPGNLAAILATPVSLAVLTAASRVAFIERRVLPAIPALFGAGLLIGLATLFALNWAHMASSVAAIVVNLFSDGRWGITWCVLLSCMLVGMLFPPIRNERFVLGVILAFAGLLIALAYPRIPYRVGWGDSANRMMTHIVPVITAYLTLKFGQAACSSVSSSSRELTWRRAAAAMVLAAVSAGLGTLRLLRPTDYALKAKVIEAPAIALGKPGERHDFGVALRGVADSEYAAADQPGPATVIVDLRRPVQASLLEITQYDADQAFVDYAWHVSPDGQLWSAVYDSQQVDGRRIMIDDLTMQFPVQLAEPFRYVRLTFRSSLGQNRLLLRKLSVYSESPDPPAAGRGPRTGGKEIGQE